jgi:hypothetical protein
MADYATLFQLVLLALTFILVGMAFIVYMIMFGEKEKRGSKAIEAPSAESQEQPRCPHYFGYLGGYPMNRPIPDECFGCMNALNCMNQRPSENLGQNTPEIEGVEPETVQ